MQISFYYSKINIYACGALSNPLLRLQKMYGLFLLFFFYYSDIPAERPQTYDEFSNFVPLTRYNFHKLTQTAVYSICDMIMQS